MIKRDWKWSYITDAVVPTKSFSFRGRLKSRYYKLDSKYLQYGYKRREEETLGPTILTTWSK
jgi:hypothetical protein